MEGESSTKTLLHWYKVNGVISRKAAVFLLTVKRDVQVIGATEEN
jgi:hypothetical protein